MFELFANYLPILATVFLTICYIPQIYKTAKTKNVESMSVWFWLLLNFALIIMWSNALLIYIETGIYGTLVTECINEFLAMVVLIQVLIYRKKV